MCLVCSKTKWNKKNKMFPLDVTQDWPQLILGPHGNRFSFFDQINICNPCLGLNIDGFLFFINKKIGFTFWWMLLWYNYFIWHSFHGKRFPHTSIIPHDKVEHYLFILVIQGTSIFEHKFSNFVEYYITCNYYLGF